MRHHHSKLVRVAAVLLAATSLQGSPAFAQAAPSAIAAAPASAKPKFGTWGVDLSVRDMSVKPGDDFQKYASGGWLANTQIPADKPSVGSFYELFDTNQDEEKDLVTNAPAGSKYGAMYQSMMDENRVEQLGLSPLKPDLAKVAAISSKAAMARHMGTTDGDFGSSIYSFHLDADTADARMNALNINQGGLGLPSRDYYLSPEFKPQRDAYVAYMQRTFQAIGNPSPAAAAARVMAFETAIAKVSWANADRRDIDKTNNPMSSAELAAYAPGFAWASYFEGAKIPAQKRIIVNEKSAIRDIARIYAATPLSTVKEWEAFHTADQASPYLNKAMVDSRFAFTKTISGVTEQRPRWKRSVTLVDGSLGELVGQDYVTKYFPPASKAKMVQLVANLKAAMAGRIQSNSWMSAPTKAAALEKLSRMDVMVGYPDKFRDYSALEVRPNDLYGNVKRATRFNADYDMEDLGKPVNHMKWGMNPQTVNAYNGGGENKIVFPAGILQPPFFDPNADDAVNYGAIGAVIGHEISHGFDDQGRKIDATGTVRDWWTKQDAARFDAEAKVFGDQYAKFEPVPGAFINPKLTMGENIADFAGIQVALDAYHRSLGGKPAPVIDGLTGDQRFFLAFAQVWREKQRDDALRSQVTTNEHSPGRFRVLGPLRNVDAWYQAFNVQPGDSMYIPPEQRARIW
ncbi:M13 family metallopeptidase [Sphingomonas sp.]|uniref:M13 family metallopeptidase n=1 Tax=Sphingomonas sp. TaxID=28214 RepID=UPI002600473E|nr:M13 family metallopeptidase [Sphingomonas sp.]MBV9528413.1 M13 family metallopeptidase [Sphingomonas sp.]